MLEGKITRLQHIDGPQCLEITNNDAEFCCGLLVKYKNIYKDTPNNLRRMMASDSPEEAMRLAHTLKGASANLCVFAVSRAAGSIEDAFRSGECQGINEKIGLLEDALQPAMMEIAQLEQTDKTGS